MRGGAGPGEGCLRIPLSNCSICMVWELFPLPLPGKLTPAGRFHSWASDSLIWPLFFFFPWLLSLVHRASEQGFFLQCYFSFGFSTPSRWSPFPGKPW